MPSDSKKREQQRKKDAQKKRNQNFAVNSKDTPEEEKKNLTITNGTNTNGTTNNKINGGPVELTEEGTCVRYN